MKTLYSLALVSGLLLGHGHAQSGGPWKITSFTIDSGGGRSTGGPWTLTGTIGQADAGSVPSSGGAWGMLGGFWTGAMVIPTPGGGPQLTLVSLGGENMQLSWPAEAVGYILQQSFDLIQWQSRPDIPVTGAGTRNFSRAGTSRYFFRLMKE